jgi:hypothetical protein
MTKLQYGLYTIGILLALIGLMDFYHGGWVLIVIFGGYFNLTVFLFTRKYKKSKEYERNENL